MRKAERKVIKDNKRAVKLMYRKGIIEDLDLPRISWESEYFGSAGWKPALVQWWEDYWGEGDYNSLIGQGIEAVFWDNAIDGTATEDRMGMPISSVNLRSAKELIQYLSNLQTVNNSSKINEIIRLTKN